MARGVQRRERAGGGNVGAVEARRDRFAERERRPAAALLERVIVRLRRCERVGLVLESTNCNHAHRVDSDRFSPAEERSTVSDPLWTWDAAALAAAIRKREISCARRRRRVRCAHARGQSTPQRRDGATCPRQALAHADLADAAVARGDALGPLHGVPVTIKENVDQEGCATVNGVAAYRDVDRDRRQSRRRELEEGWRASSSAAPTRRRSAFASTRSTTSAAARHSPWSRGHTPGGSSGGASASVAAGITPLAHGNDIAGSVRYPAYCTGLAGLRPSFGRVPAYNPSGKAERTISAQLMSVQGPLARSVRDVRLGFEAMAQYDPRDPWWTPAPLTGASRRRPASRGGGRRARRTWAASRRQRRCAGGAEARRARRWPTPATRWSTRRRPDSRAAFELWFEMLDPGVPPLHARGLRARRRRGHPHRDALRARQRAGEGRGVASARAGRAHARRSATGISSSRARRWC